MLVIPRLEHFNPNFYYYTKGDIDYALLVIEGRGKKIFTSRMNLGYAKELVGEAYEFKSFWKAIKGKAVKLDEAHGSIKLYREIEKRAKSVVEVSEELERRRAKKTREEIETLSRASRLSLEIVREFEFDEGMREEEVAKKLSALAYERADGIAFEPIVANIENARFPHYKPGKAKIGDAFLIDFGVKQGYYNGDITEVIFLNKSKRKEEYKKYEEIKEIFYELVDGIREGMEGKEVAEKAKELYKRKRLRFPPHLIGHGVGLDVHERPSLGEESRDELKSCVLAIEPAWYGKFGVRFEREVVVIGGKIKVVGRI